MSRATQQIVYVVNRSTEPLDCMSDGVPFVLRPGYRREPIINQQTGEQEVDAKTQRPLFGIVGNAPDGRVLTEPLALGAAMRAEKSASFHASFGGGFSCKHVQ